MFCPKTNILYILVNKSIWIPDHLPDHHKPQPSWKKNLKVIKSLFLDNCEISLHSEDVERWWLVLSYKEKREKMSWLFWVFCCHAVVTWCSLTSLFFISEREHAQLTRTSTSTTDWRPRLNDLQGWWLLFVTTLCGDILRPVMYFP